MCSCWVLLLLDVCSAAGCVLLLYAAEVVPPCSCAVCCVYTAAVQLLLCGSMCSAGMRTAVVFCSAAVYAQLLVPLLLLVYDAVVDIQLCLVADCVRLLVLSTAGCWWLLVGCSGWLWRCCDVQL